MVEDSHIPDLIDSDSRSTVESKRSKSRWSKLAGVAALATAVATGTAAAARDPRAPLKAERSIAQIGAVEQSATYRPHTKSEVYYLSEPRQRFLLGKFKQYSDQMIAAIQSGKYQMKVLPQPKGQSEGNYRWLELSVPEPHQVSIDFYLAVPLDSAGQPIVETSQAISFGVIKRTPNRATMRNAIIDQPQFNHIMFPNDPLPQRRINTYYADGDPGRDHIPGGVYTVDGHLAFFQEHSVQQLQKIDTNAINIAAGLFAEAGLTTGNLVDRTPATQAHHHPAKH